MGLRESGGGYAVRGWDSAWQACLTHQARLELVKAHAFIFFRFFFFCSSDL